MQRPRLRLWSLALVLLLLGGCAQIPPFWRPATAVPEGWRLAAADADAFPPADWWRGFGSAELTELVATAQRNNPDLLAAASRIAQAAALTRAAAAGLYPTLEGSGSASRTGGFTRDQPDRKSYQLALDAAYEIDLWGRNRAGVLAARAQEAATRFDRDAIALTLTADVATSYLQYLALGDRLETARANLANARRILELVEARQRLGATSALEVAQQRAAVAALEAALPELGRQQAQTLNALALLLGQAPQQARVAGGSLSEVTLPAVSPGLPSELLTRRPDIGRAEADLAAANADIGAARAAFFPTIRLTAGTGFASAALGSLFDPGGAFYDLAAGLVAPIFEGGRLSAELDRSRARYDELLHAYRGAVVAAFGDVEDALAAAKYLAEVEAAQRRAVAQNREAFRLAETQFRAGAIDFLTVLETQRSLFQAEDALLQTRLGRLSAAVGLFRALGGGWGAEAAPGGWRPIS